MARKTTFKAPEGVHYRTATIDRALVNDEARTVELCFSSESPVERAFGLEILDHSPESCDLSRINAGGPLLLGHNPDDQIGVIESARIDADKRGRAVVRFSKSARGQEIFQDVKDGIRSNVSVGYRLGNLIRKEKVDGVEAYRLAFTPLEVSLVSIPADASVGVGRAEDVTTADSSNPETIMPTIIENTPDLAAVRAEVLKGEQKRTAELLAIGAKFSADTEARAFIAEGKSVEDFRAWVLENKFNAKPVTQSPDVGLSEKEKRNFSILRAIRQLSTGHKLDGLEKEASDAACKRYGRDNGANTFTIPHDMVTHKRADYTAGTNSAGGFTIQTDVLGTSLIELLRNKMVTASLGARNLSGLVGNVAIPRQASGATAYWVAENAAITESEGTFEQLSLTPHRLGAYSEISKTLLAQSTIDMEGFVRNDLMAVLAIAKDTAALQGSGASGQPTGIVNTSGVGSVTFGGAATNAKVIEFETAVASANADVGRMSYVTTAAVRGAWKGITKASNYPVYLWETGANGAGMVNGYNAVVTNSISSNKVVFGNFDSLILADWAGIDISVNPYSLDTTGLVRVVVQMLTDVGVRHAASFAVSSDAGNQ